MLERTEPRNEFACRVRRDGRERPGAGQDLGRPALHARGKVEHDADRGVEILPQPVGQSRQRLDANGGRVGRRSGGTKRFCGPSRRERQSVMNDPAEQARERARQAQARAVAALERLQKLGDRRAHDAAPEREQRSD